MVAPDPCPYCSAPLCHCVNGPLAQSNRYVAAGAWAESEAAETLGVSVERWRELRAGAKRAWAAEAEVWGPRGYVPGDEWSGFEYKE